jgi:hypothetical protein
MEVRGLVRNPCEEARHGRMGPELRDVRPDPRKLRIGELLVQNAVTDRMDRHRLPATAALGQWVMLLDASAKRALAKPACLLLVLAHRLQ